MQLPKTAISAFPCDLKHGKVWAAGSYCKMFLIYMRDLLFFNEMNVWESLKVKRILSLKERLNILKYIDYIEFCFTWNSVNLWRECTIFLLCYSHFKISWWIWIIFVTLGMGYVLTNSKYKIILLHKTVLELDHFRNIFINYSFWC